MSSPVHILLIEDDPAVGQSLMAGLERENYMVTWKDLGTQGVDYALKHHPQLIILDVRLPDGSGFDFCRQMRQAGLRQPILILTAQHDEMDKVLGLEMGADDYITKPFGLRELYSRVRAQLRRAYGDLSNTEADLLFADDLTIDQTRGQVTRAGQPITLTPIEFRLLVYLARHRNQALSRGQIIEAVWGHTPDPDSEKTVNVHVRHLREKVELDPENPTLILTVPGIGYRLVG
jgi:two-component system alkaline phosphatase synthesis response regulator PhoP